MKNNVLKLLFTVAILLLGTQFMSAQNYQSAIGARLGSPISVSYKYFLSEKSAVEGYVGFRSISSSARWLSVNGAYLVHNPLDDVLDGLQWYFGGGAGVYFYSSDFLDSSSTFLGIQGYVGLDYTLQNVPVNVTLDWSPTLFIGDGFLNGFGSGYYAAGVRYILGE
ncbi:MAG: hypothetical protein AAF738_04730 [Bacteroidota bacterium]